MPESASPDAAANADAREPGGWRYALGTFFYSGAIPLAPGTMGSIATMLIVLAIELAIGVLAPWIWLAAGLGVLVLGIPVGDSVERAFRIHDPGWFVLDEVSGVLLAYALIGWFGAPMLEGLLDAQSAWALSIFVALIFFRAYDIAKPWPIRRVERIGAGAGIMADDAVAGLMAGASGVLAIWLIRIALAA